MILLKNWQGLITSTKFDCFSAIMRGYGDENIVQTKEYFTQDFFKKTPKLNAQVSRDLVRLGAAKIKVILV